MEDAKQSFVITGVRMCFSVNTSTLGFFFFPLNSNSVVLGTLLILLCTFLDYHNTFVKCGF